MGKTPGDGKTSPFGNGRGNVGERQTMPNDFRTNPGGSMKPGTPSQTRGENPVNPNDAAPGGRIPLADATPVASKAIGVGSIGNGAKPFRLDGGG